MKWLNLIYLSGPVGSMDGAGHAWREVVREALLKEFSIATFSPAHAFFTRDANGMGDPLSWAIFAVNQAAIQSADAVLCVLPRDKQSIGSIREIEMARRWDRPVILVTGGHRPHFGVDLEIVPTLPDAYFIVRKWLGMSREAVRALYQA